MSSGGLGHHNKVQLVDLNEDWVGIFVIETVTVFYLPPFNEVTQGLYEGGGRVVAKDVFPKVPNGVKWQ